MNPFEPIPHSFFDVSASILAPKLIGGYIIRKLEDITLIGRIVETEAYIEDDLANHATRGLTSRTRVLFGPPGHAYIYLIYGIHYCLNAVAKKGEAVLIRALEPISGIDYMMKKRGTADIKKLCSGPGKICQALDLNLKQNGSDLSSGSFFLAKENVDAKDIDISKRIGITKDAHLNLRFTLKSSPYISK